MLGFVGLDLRSIRPNVKFLFIPVLVVGVPVLLVLGPYLLIPAVSSLALASAPAYLFGNDERGRLDTLYTALGIRRRHVVAGRYVTCLIVLIVCIVTGLLLASVSAYALDVAFDATVAAALTAGSVALVGIFLAAGLPAYFGTGPGSARVLAIIPSVLLAAVFPLWTVENVRVAMLSWLGSVSLAGLSLVAVAVLGVLGVASAGLSMRLYARRDL